MVCQKMACEWHAEQTTRWKVPGEVLASESIKRFCLLNPHREACKDFGSFDKLLLSTAKMLRKYSGEKINNYEV